jgi:hypothetical protein
MRYDLPYSSARGGHIDECPILSILSFDAEQIGNLQAKVSPERVIVLTQTCDFANLKVSCALAAVLIEAKSLVDQQLLKAADIRGPIRAGRVYDWYYLPKSAEHGLPESIVDLRQLHTCANAATDVRACNRYIANTSPSTSRTRTAVSVYLRHTKRNRGLVARSEPITVL